jgi:ribosomal protein S3AE
MTIPCGKTLKVSYKWHKKAVSLIRWWAEITAPGQYQLNMKSGNPSEKNTRLWTRYMETHQAEKLQQYKKARNKLRNIT